MGKPSKDYAVPLWEKANLTVYEAAAYSGIGADMLPLFGKNKSNVTISWSSMIASAGAMLAPVVVKFAGSYNNFFIIGAVIYVIVLVLTIIATMPSSLQKIKDVDAKYVEAHGITEAE